MLRLLFFVWSCLSWLRMQNTLSKLRRPINGPVTIFVTLLTLYIGTTRICREKWIRPNILITAGRWFRRCTSLSGNWREALLEGSAADSRGCLPFLSEGTAYRNRRDEILPGTPWFNVILFRGLKALYLVDRNEAYIKTMIENADYAWNYTRDENGLFSNDWSGNRKEQFKSLLENACMIELFAEISELQWIKPLNTINNK